MNGVNMMRSSGDVVEEEDDLFFDSVDCIRTSVDSSLSEDSVNVSSDLGFCEFGYDVWRNELMSVRDRRERFFREMGFGELMISSSSQLGSVDSLNFSESGLIMNSNGVVSASLPYSSDRMRKEECSVGKIRDLVDIRSRPKDVLSNVTMQEVERSRGISNSVEEVAPKNGFFTEEDNWGRGLDNIGRRRNGMDWWKRFVKRRGQETYKCDGSGSRRIRRMRVRKHKKRCLEFTALYMGQEIQAHKGCIWTMKFSPDGKFLASGGEDGIVRIWRVVEAGGVCCKHLEAENLNYTKFVVDKIKEVKSIPGQKNSSPASVVVPNKVFRIEEALLHEFHGHTCAVLDLSWSKSKCLLSSSEDKTVRLWKVGCRQCLKVFHHNDYVTCVQFNPADDRYFISGSIDGKIRIWGVLENRVVDWANVHDIITAVCYRPDGQGCIVGSIAGNCRFYDASGNHLQLDAQLYIQGKKKPTGKRITGFQFSPEDSHRVMITSADSKVRILDSVDIIHKYRGLRKSGNQMSASFTSNGRHIVSVGENSHVYIWNCNNLGVPSSKDAKSVRSCEHFFSEGVLVAIPWLGMEPEQNNSGEDSLYCSTQQLKHLESSFSWPRDPDRFSLGSWFFNDSLSRASATWPEEKLPLWAIPVSEDDDHQLHHHGHHHERHTSLPATWGMVIVTAGSDGMIRSFHNYGMPSRI